MVSSVNFLRYSPVCWLDRKHIGKLSKPIAKERFFKFCKPWLQLNRFDSFKIWSQMKCFVINKSRRSISDIKAIKEWTLIEFIRLLHIAHISSNECINALNLLSACMCLMWFRVNKWEKELYSWLAYTHFYSFQINPVQWDERVIMYWNVLQMLKRITEIYTTICT